MFLFYDSYGNRRIFSDSFWYDNVHLELCIYICCLLPDFMQLVGFGEACLTKNDLMFSLEFVF